MGTGSAMAHRAVDAVMGPRTIVHEQAGGSEGGAPAAADPCASFTKSFNDCLANSNNDIAQCQFYFDKLTSCKKGGSAYN